MLQTLIKINSVDVTSYVISYEIESTYQEAITGGELTVAKTIGSAVSLVNGQTVEIWRGWTTSTDAKIFSGYIEQFNPDNGKIVINFKDKAWDLVRKEMTHTYDSSIDAFGGKISAIFQDIVTTYAGLNADSGTIQDSGTAQIINKFVCNHVDPYERCQALAQALDWQFYYRADTDKIYFEPTGYTTNANTLQVGTNIQKSPKWTYDVTEMVNDLTVVGASSDVQTTETGQIGVTMGYTTSSVQLNFKPNSVKVYNDNSNPPTTLKAGGITGSTSTYDYTVDYTRNQILPFTSFSSNSYVQTQYTHAIPIPLHMTSPGSITSYGQFKKTITFTDIQTLNDAESRGKDYLTKYAQPFVYATVQVNSTSDLGLRVGQTISVIDTIATPNVNEPLLISRLRYKYPGNYDELDIGDKIWRLAEWQAEVNEQFKRFSESELNNQDITTELVEFDNSIIPIDIENRYFATYQQTSSGDILILGNPIYGIWGNYKWGQNVDIDLIWDNDLTNWDDNNWSLGGWSAEILDSMQQSNNVYTETFYDNDFKDATTTATWTSSGLAFTAGQIGQSSSIDYRNGTITTAKLTSIESSGSFEYFMNASGNTSQFSTGTITGATYVTGIVGNYALSFNGSSDYAVIPNANQNQIGSKLSISCWVTPSVINSGYTELVEKGDGTYWEYGLILTNGNLLFNIWQTAGANHASSSSPETLVAGQTYHIVGTYEDGVGTKIYVNGVLKNTNTTFAGVTMPSTSTIQIGRRYNGTRYFGGVMDEVLIYNTILSQTEVSTLYAKTPIYSGLVAKYSFEEGSGNKAFDTSNWERVVSGTSYTFANSGTDLRWKACEKAGSTGTITKVVVGGYH